MASIIKRKKAYSVVYSYTDERGETKQKWETCYSHKEALKRKAEIENQQFNGTFSASKQNYRIQLFRGFCSYIWREQMGSFHV